MYYSFKELKKLANLPNDLNINDITKAITAIGFEVEGYEPFTDLEGLRFGKITKIEMNPNADMLRICEIQLSDGMTSIQTNANNVYEGQVVVAFVPGSRSGNITFSSKELKGVISNGMLSSPSEFGIDKNLLRPDVHDGIASYDEVLDLSIDPITYLDLDDFIIEVDILSNRSDAASYYVMAIELAAYFKTQVKLPTIKEGNMKTSINAKNNNLSSLTMLEAKNNFSITIKEQIFLNKHKIKSINNAADLSNLALLYAGQPTHAYDADKVGKEFEAKPYTGNALVLGNKEVVLDKTLVIHSDNIPVSVASVIGFEETSSKKDTERIILELGIFDIKSVRKAAKDVRLTTESASQGGKALAKGTTSFALAYITNKLNDFSNIINFDLPKKTEVVFDTKTTIALAGFDITKEQKYKDVIQSLELLGFEFIENIIKVPTYRHDIKSMQDINEEIFRFYGYENFSAKAPTLTPFIIQNILNIKDSVVGQGYQEVKTYSLISLSKNIINPFNFENSIKLKTFVSKEREVIRNSQAVSLIDVVDYNTKRGMKDISLFSKGMINNGIKTLGLISTIKSFRDIQKDLVNLLPSLTFEKINNSSLHPGVSAKILKDNKQVGWIGKIHPSISSIDAIIAEVNVDAFEPSNITISDYKTEPLLFEDITYELSSKEELASKLKNIDAFSIKVIDEYKTEDKLKVTVRITK